MLLYHTFSIKSKIFQKISKIVNIFLEKEYTFIYNPSKSEIFLENGWRYHIITEILFHFIQIVIEAKREYPPLSHSGNAFMQSKSRRKCIAFPQLSI